MPRPPKEIKAPPPPPTETEIEATSLELASSSLEEEAKKKLKSDQLRKLKKIAYYTAKVGLPLEEACLLVDVDYEKFQEEMKLEPLIGKIIRMKELEFKKDMLHTLASKARSGDDKLAQWLLERKFPDEYGTKQKKGDGEGGDIIFEAIRFIRSNGDNHPLVTEAGARPVHATLLPSGVLKTQSVESKALPSDDRIADILSATKLTE